MLLFLLLVLLFGKIACGWGHCWWSKKLLLPFPWHKGRLGIGSAACLLVHLLALFFWHRLLSPAFLFDSDSIILFLTEHSNSVMCCLDRTPLCFYLKKKKTFPPLGLMLWGFVHHLWCWLFCFLSNPLLMCLWKQWKMGCTLGPMPPTQQDQDVVCGYWLWPGSALAIMTIWELNQQVEAFCLSSSLCNSDFQVIIYILKELLSLVVFLGGKFSEGP